LWVFTMRILFAASEAVPFWKTGGLADVAGALPAALARRGHRVLLVHPFYPAVRALDVPMTAWQIRRVPWGGSATTVRYLWAEPAGDAPVVFVDHPRYFETDAPYLDAAADPWAAARRFAFFSRAVADVARSWAADVVHLNDWQTGLVPLYLSEPAPATVFAIHNLAYQGNYDPGVLAQIGLPSELFRTEQGIEFYGRASFLKAGLVFADQLVTVSPTYAREIRTPAFGAGLDGVLRYRSDRLRGILNGIDPDAWDPAADAALPARYSAREPAGKGVVRAELLRELRLDEGPVLVFVGRLAHQKGIDLVLGAIPDLLEAGARLAVLGDGDAAHVEALGAAARAAPGRVAVRFGFDDPLARLLYAGGDLFLMPSLYEPCGLGQMIAQRYGTPPIVRATGGLADTVEDGATGFSFVEPTAGELSRAVRRGLAVLATPAGAAMRRRCMELDWSWARSAAAYERVYRDAARDGRRAGRGEGTGAGTPTGIA
jgi:starch synthase